MIDTTKLTAENGFVEGCVVEIVWDDGHCKIVYWRTKTEWRWEKIRNITPLTGPMAIWNFAPEWAQWCAVDKLNITWWDHDPPKQFNWTEVSRRPFWARSEK